MIEQRHRAPTPIVVVALLAYARGAAGQAQPAPAPTEVTGTPAAAFRWTEPDGKPLPFRSEDELLVFLKAAEVKAVKPLSGGITHPLKMRLEKDGVRANAVFRDVNEEAAMKSFDSGRSELHFRDSYLFEPAAYELSRLLGLDSVPPATLRTYEGRNGSVQIWVEGAMTEMDRAKGAREAPDPRRWNMQVQMMNVFDALVYNTDRNRGNVLITPDWKLWMIDHTRAFRRQRALQDAHGPVQCERGLFQRLRGLDEGVLRDRMKPYLKPAEIDALVKRRSLIVGRLEKVIAERGESKVLYTYGSEAPLETP